MADNLRDKLEKDLKEKEANVRQKFASGKQPGGGPSLKAPKNVYAKKEMGWITAMDITNFCRELAIMLEVGVPLLKSLELIAERTRKASFQKVVKQIAGEVSEGKLFSDACAKFPNVFNTLFVDIIRVGESAGILDNSLKRLETIFVKQLYIKSKVKSAMAYPAIALVAASIVLTVILIIVVPQFETLYSENNVELPQITQITIGLGHFMTNFWYLVFAGIIGAFIGLKFLLKIPVVKIIFDFIKLRMPILNKVYINIMVAQITRTFETLMKSGIPLRDSLKILAETSPNHFYGQDFSKVVTHIEEGGRMAEKLNESGIFPPVVVDLLAIGEDTGSIETVLSKLSEYYEEMVENQLKALSSIIEPILIILLGIIVLIIAISFLLPYFKLVQVIHSS